MGPFGYQGAVEVVCGPMFSGKTEELIRRVRRTQIARQKVQIFKPALDDRYSKKEVVSHSSLSLDAEVVESAIEILQRLDDSTRVVAIDEVQFFDVAVNAVVAKLARRGCRVICAGLDLDYKGVPFAPMPNLLALADDVTKLSAICTICGDKATRTQRLVDSQEQVLVGEAEAYEARCRYHYDGPSETEQSFFPQLTQEFRVGSQKKAKPDNWPLV